MVTWVSLAEIYTEALKLHMNRTAWHLSSMASGYFPEVMEIRRKNEGEKKLYIAKN